MNDSRLDDEIDRVVLRMLDVSAPPELLARVQAQIEHSRPRITWAQAALSAAAAVLLIVALGWDLPVPAPVVIPPGRTVTSGVNSGSTRLPVPPSAPPAAPRRDVARETFEARAPRTPRREPASRAPLPLAPDDLPPIEFAEVVVAPPEAPAAIEPWEIVIAPLPEPADVVVEPLQFPPGARE